MLRSGGRSVGVHSCGGQEVYLSVLIHVEDIIHVEVRGYVSQCSFMRRSVGISVSVNSCGGQGVPVYESVLIHAEVNGYRSQC